MSTIRDTLENANYNLQNNGKIGESLGKQQLHNAVTLIEKGYSLETDIDELLSIHKSIENIPNRKSSKSISKLVEQEGISVKAALKYKGRK